jgi:hypothetical protein
LLICVGYKGITELENVQTGPFVVRETRNEIPVQRVMPEGISVILWQNCPTSFAVKLHVRAVGCIKFSFM